MAAAVGAAAGIAAERVVVGRPLRRGETPGGRLGLGQLRGRVVEVELSDGVHLHTEIDDPRDGGTWPGLTVVFVHGYALNLDCFHYQRQALRGSARLVFYDQRSHGRSERGSTESSTVEQLADDLREVFDSLVPAGPIVLVGHSMGGMTVLELARQSPDVFGDRVVGVVLMSTSAGELGDVTLGLPSIAVRTFKRLAPTLIKIGKHTSQLVERGRQMSSDLAILITKVYAFAGDVPAEVIDFSLDMINGTPIDVLGDFYPAFAKHDVAGNLQVLNGTETLVLVGAQDLLTPAAHSKVLVREIPGAELVVLDPGGHLIMLERPDDANAHVIDLIDRAARGVGG
jgi:pimeloyl-ACP methyl ester carboxylesterase